MRKYYIWQVTYTDEDGRKIKNGFGTEEDATLCFLNRGGYQSKFKDLTISINLYEKRDWIKTELDKIETEIKEFEKSL